MAAVLTSAQLATAASICGYLSPPLPLNSAIAFCGNIGQESAFNSKAVQAGEGAFGFCQWEGDRLNGADGLKAWCAANHLDYASVEGQCKFILHEYPAQAPQIAPWITDTSGDGQPKRSIATLTADICQFYERPGNPQLENRIAYANQVAQHLTSPVSASVSTPAPVPAFVPAPTIALDKATMAFIIKLLTALQA